MRRTAGEHLMPEYRFLNALNGSEVIYDMMISEYDSFLLENPDLQPLINGFPGMHSGRGLGVRKIDDGFNDVLKKIKKAHSGGYRLGRSNINTK